MIINIPPSPLQKGGDAEVVLLKTFWTASILHKVIHQVKSWIRGIYSWASEFNIDRYLAEYSFRINRSQNKDTIFNKLMKRIVERSSVSQSQLVCS